MKKYDYVYGLVMCLVWCVSGQAQEVITLKTVLQEMTDRDQMARYPSPDYICRQFSSYDRSATEKGKEGWFGNYDKSMFLGIEKTEGRTEYVMMDTEGPGMIVRFWMTFAGKNCGKGTLRIYVDHNPLPVIQGKAMDVLSGKLVTEAPLAASVSELTPYENRGHNLYFPILFDRHCKVTYESEGLREDDPGAKREGTESVYYNINYRLYSAELVKVVSYTPEDQVKYQKWIRETNELLKRKSPDENDYKLRTLDLQSLLAPGEKRSFRIKGGGAIRNLTCALEAAQPEQALRSTVVEISFDGQRTVWCPIGDFFGIGYHVLKTDTWYTHCTPEGSMSAYWVMPFAKECILTIHNLGNQKVQVKDAFVKYSPWKWDKRSMHFGATWQQYTRVLCGKDHEARDLNYVTLQGKGVYVGDALTVYNTTNAWWGEGDEKVYVDGETFPSHFGTGTEDYYGYAWCREEPFTGHPFIAQPLGEGNYDPGYTVNSRYRILDAIPFRTSMVFDMELWHWLRSELNYAPVSFWYALPEAGNESKPDTAGAKEKIK